MLYRKVRITIERSDGIEEVILEETINEKEQAFFEIQGDWSRRKHLRIPE